ncbi:GAF and ANTAR domain-containing protein [Pengzhenrongella sicca]|uniref:GAF and ANTAR domain-containing protein n=1 Tax=Pengzhenrongella sicca TaxID=2819238 RepID=A0A8A4ZE02_9MICO|nr:GAF and ANTAR domain-containing protein [Pengzhenrongella sicca]QTE27928.1 GAF and ANTAR domain-containing protein [Pengzhenrongella sicca]
MPAYRQAPDSSTTAVGDGQSNGHPHDAARELQDLLLSTEGVEQFLGQLIELAVASIGGGISAGVTVARDGHPATVASSDERAAQYDEIQYGYDDGPCLTAMRARKLVLIEDMEHEERFNGYREHALALGVRSSLSLPLDGGTRCYGALNLYSRSAQAFGPRAQAEAQRFTDEASRALNLAARIAHHAEISDQLRTALTSRTVIDQAIGIIMAQNRSDADVAFAILRTASQNRNVKLRIVAAEIITAVSNKAPVPHRPFGE